MQPTFVAVKILIQYCRHLNNRNVDCIITTPISTPPSCKKTAM